jgi:hypothetical protein
VVPEQEIAGEEDARDRAKADRCRRQATVASPFGETDEGEQREAEEGAINRPG